MDKSISVHQVFGYLDGLLLITKTFESHLPHLSAVVHCMWRAGLTLNVRKSIFVINGVRGPIIGNGMTLTDSDKVRAISDFPRPKTVKQLWPFFWMCGRYQEFVATYSSLTTVAGLRNSFWSTMFSKQVFLRLRSCIVLNPLSSSSFILMQYGCKW